MFSFYEFFAGGGMARAGLGDGWDCLFANDFDARKGLTYQLNWGVGGELRVGDVRAVRADDLPGQADLVWGSFPCQDLSLAGVGAGLKGERSGAFYPFWDVLRGLAAAGRAPKLVVIENVVGALTSHGGQDFQAICRTFAEAGYRYGALVIDAALFVPQSRPRLFVIGVREDVQSDALTAWAAAMPASAGTPRPIANSGPAIQVRPTATDRGCGRSHCSLMSRPRGCGGRPWRVRRPGPRRSWRRGP